MKETVQQYKARILGQVEGKNPLTVYKSTPDKIARLIRGVSSAQLRRRPAPGKWSIAEILAHLAETEIVIGYRFRMIRNKNGTPIQAFDQDDWAASSNYQKMDARQSLESFRALRKLNYEWARRVPKAKLQNYGIHAERGKETIAHLFRMFAGHDLNHLKQIERLRAR